MSGNVEEPAIPQAKEEAISCLRVRDVGALEALGSFARSPQERTKMMVVCVDQLALYQVTTQDKRP
jgi:hypothetical protein